MEGRDAGFMGFVRTQKRISNTSMEGSGGLGCVGKGGRGVTAVAANEAAGLAIW